MGLSAAVATELREMALFKKKNTHRLIRVSVKKFNNLSMTVILHFLWFLGKESLPPHRYNESNNCIKNNSHIHCKQNIHLKNLQIYTSKQCRERQQPGEIELGLYHFYLGYVFSPRVFGDSLRSDLENWLKTRMAYFNKADVSFIHCNLKGEAWSYSMSCAKAVVFFSTF